MLLQSVKDTTDVCMYFIISFEVMENNYFASYSKWIILRTNCKTFVKICDKVFLLFVGKQGLIKANVYM